MGRSSLLVQPRDLDGSAKGGYGIQSKPGQDGQELKDDGQRMRGFVFYLVFSRRTPQ